MRLYHAGLQRIKTPNVHYGRKNADFGQGFYLTDDLAFARRWAGRRRDEPAVINVYDLDTEGLSVKEFDRSPDWFDYIFANRMNRPDTRPEDVIIGPIANDTIYETFGITTSGYLKREEALRLLMIGPAFTQIVLKTQAAAGRLTWLDAVIPEPEEIRRAHAAREEEEGVFLRQFAAEMEKIVDGEEP